MSDSERTGPFWDVMAGRKPPPPAAVTLGFKLLEIDPARGATATATARIVSVGQAVPAHPAPAPFAHPCAAASA